MRNEPLVSKLMLSTAGGMVLIALVFMAHAPLRDFFHLHKSVTLVHFCFGSVFFVALFWGGFFVTWIVFSFLLWSAETLRYHIRYQMKGEAEEERKKRN